MEQFLQYFKQLVEALAGLLRWLISELMAPVVLGGTRMLGHEVSVGQAEFISVVLLLAAIWIYQYRRYHPAAAGRPQRIVHQTDRTPQEVVSTDFRNRVVIPLMFAVIAAIAIYLIVFAGSGAPGG
jgi:hypothetical protein